MRVCSRQVCTKHRQQHWRGPSALVYAFNTTPNTVTNRCSSLIDSSSQRGFESSHTISILPTRLAPALAQTLSGAGCTGSVHIYESGEVTASSHQFVVMAYKPRRRCLMSCCLNASQPRWLVLWRKLLEMRAVGCRCLQ